MKRWVVVSSLLVATAAFGQASRDEERAAPGAPAAAPPTRAAGGGGSAKPVGLATGKPEPAKPEAHVPPKPGEQHQALQPFVKSAAFTGKMMAGAMGPGSPELPTTGRSTCKWMLSGLWAACDITGTVGTGKQAMKWAAHWMVGWDFASKDYRGAFLDTEGLMTWWKGTLADNKLVMTTVGDVMMAGQPVSMRMTFDASDAKAVKMTTEHKMKGGDWKVVEEDLMKPAAK
jgi:hypothetical protein